uniref:Uncharacterized protein n=1 Tax=Setaria italica TaxID=4555 RepID=K4A3Y9_SETIT
MTEPSHPAAAAAASNRESNSRILGKISNFQQTNCRSSTI